MHSNKAQLNWVKEVDNTVSIQWSQTLCFDEVFTSQQIRRVYCNLKKEESVYMLCVLFSVNRKEWRIEKEVWNSMWNANDPGIEAYMTN